MLDGILLSTIWTDSVSSQLSFHWVLSYICILKQTSEMFIRIELLSTSQSVRSDINQRYDTKWPSFTSFLEFNWNKSQFGSAWFQLSSKLELQELVCPWILNQFARFWCLKLTWNPSYLIDATSIDNNVHSNILQDFDLCIQRHIQAVCLACSI